MNYILEGKIPKPCNDLIKFGKWFEKSDRQIKITFLSHGIRISTVFLGMDHSFTGGTLIFF